MLELADLALDRGGALVQAAARFAAAKGGS
jgi:hypothetical protein